MAISTENRTEVKEFVFWLEISIFTNVLVIGNGIGHLSALTKRHDYATLVYDDWVNKHLSKQTLL